MLHEVETLLHIDVRLLDIKILILRLEIGLLFLKEVFVGIGLLEESFLFLSVFIDGKVGLFE